ncbi:hypothetical protein HRbin39_00773 [bacterium HR39]|nr:hypothetical protein HRbin39_00773 [bacterium HR39]
MSIDPLLLSQLQAFVSVVLINIVLSGDNAVVVGTAAAGLPPRQQRRVIAIGMFSALVLRIVFAVAAVELLEVFGLVLAGGILLLWVAWRMWRELEPAGGAVAEEAGAAAASGPAVEKTLGSAVTQVIVADVSMSLDNVLAVAGAAREHPVIMAFGLVLSVALMGVAAGVIARLIERYHWIAYVGILLVLWVALQMIWEGGREVWGVLHEGGFL